MVSDATMLNAATTMMIPRNSAMISFCICSAMKRLWFSVSQSITRGSWPEPVLHLRLNRPRHARIPEAQLHAEQRRPRPAHPAGVLEAHVGEPGVVLVEAHPEQANHLKAIGQRLRVGALPDCERHEHRDAVADPRPDAMPQLGAKDDPAHPLAFLRHRAPGGRGQPVDPPLGQRPLQLLAPRLHVDAFEVGADPPIMTSPADRLNLAMLRRPGRSRSLRMYVSASRSRSSRPGSP